MTPRRTDRIPLDLPGLVGDAGVFRIDGGPTHDAAVARWFRAEPQDLRSIALHWFEHMRRCGADVRELIHDGCPVACIGDAPFGYVNTYAKHVSVGFFNGAVLHDPAGLLQGSGKRMRHVKLRPEGEVDASALGDLVAAAYTDLKERLAE